MKIRSLFVLLAVAVGLLGCSSSAPTNGTVADEANDLSKKSAGTPDAPSATTPQATSGSGEAPTAAMGPKGIGGKH